jgi:hypothetical protein
LFTSASPSAVVSTAPPSKLFALSPPGLDLYVDLSSYSFHSRGPLIPQHNDNTIWCCVPDKTGPSTPLQSILPHHSL